MPFVILGFQKGIDQAEGMTGKVDPSDILTPALRKFIESQSFDKAKLITGTTKDALKEKLQEALDNGDSVQAFAKTIRDTFGGMEKPRSLAIARTEMTSSVNNGLTSTLKHEGQRQKEWSTVIDGRERESHHDANGQVVGIDEPFQLPGGSGMYPGDPRLPPSELVNCVLDAETPILTNRGEKPIRDIRVGDIVWTHQNRWRRVERVLSEKYWSGSAVELQVGDRRLLLTPEHKVWTGVQWIRADSLLPGDMVGVAPPSIPQSHLIRNSPLGGVDSKSRSIWLRTALSARHRQSKIRELALHAKIWANQFYCRLRLCSDCLVAIHHAPILTRRLPIRVNDSAAQNGPNVFDHLPVGIHDKELHHKIRHSTTLGFEPTEGNATLSIHDSGKPGEVQLGGHPSNVQRAVAACKRVTLTGVRLWNFSVEEDHSYTAAGIVTKNCRCSLVVPNLPDERKRALYGRFLRLHGALERGLVVSLRQHFERQRRRVLAHFPSA